MKKVALFLLIIFLVSCTQNQRAKNLGGKAEIILPAGKKLINATWKDEDLWYLTRDMHPGEVAETYTFSEESSYGILEGTYIIKEQQ